MQIEQLCRQNLLAPGFLAAAEYHEELPSTSDRALELASRPDVARPVLVVARRQTAGRGRGEKGWWSTEGSLTFSLLLDLPPGGFSRPPGGLSHQRQPLVSLVAGLAIRQALAEFLPADRVGLKWPNDVWLNDRKVAGILVEVPATQPPALVIGVGINVNNSFAAAPQQLRGQATSLCDETSNPCNAGALLQSVLRELVRELAGLASGETGLTERWPAVCVLSGRRIRVTAGREACEGECLGVDDGGALLVDDGLRVERCVAGSVEIPDRAPGR